MSALKPLRKPAAKPIPRGGTRAAGGGGRSIAIFVALLAVVGIGIATMVFIGRGNGSIAPSAVSVEEAVRPLNAPTGQTPEGFWYKGQVDAPVTVVVYGDFQCPACRAAFLQIEGELDRLYVDTGKIKFVYHDFPLSIHANAGPAAQAARAAGTQGKFWQMHDLLYARQDEWADDRQVVDRLKSYAAELGLDQQAFDRAMDDKEYAPVIAAAANAGAKRGINSTPTYLVDGNKTDVGALSAAIDAALRAKGR